MALAAGSGRSCEAVIGLEAHVQLATRTKAFCRCPNRFGAPPNTLVCPVCLGYPGALPVLNRRAVELGMRLALAVEARLGNESRFVRKSYLYPDLPKGYQITQLDQPLAEGGRLPLREHPGALRLRRLHLEEDSGRLLHEAPGGGALHDATLVDFNRAGVPLVEVVSEPCLESPAHAEDALRALRELLLHTGVSDGKMEDGALRCDANVSLRRPGEKALGTKTEIKNLNSFRHLARALEHEIERQQSELMRSGRVLRQTRAYDATTGVTVPLRAKEETPDYRFLPEPDLPAIRPAAVQVERIRCGLPALPWDRRRRYVEELRLSPADAALFARSPELAGYFDAAVGADPRHARAVAKWIRTEILHQLRRRGEGIERAVAPERLARLVGLVAAGRLPHSAGRTVLEALWEEDDDPAAVAARLGLTTVADRGRLTGWVEETLRDHPRQVDAYRRGKRQLLRFFIGQVLRRSDGRAAPQQVEELLLAALARPATPRGDEAGPRGAAP